MLRVQVTKGYINTFNSQLVYDPDSAVVTYNEPYNRGMTEFNNMLNTLAKVKSVTRMIIVYGDEFIEFERLE